MLNLFVGPSIVFIFLTKFSLLPFHYLMFSLASLGFPGGSVGKESACSAGDAGDTGLIPGLGRSPGGRHGNPHRYSC